MENVWFKTEQIETSVKDERKKLIILHQCGDDKESLVGQLKQMIIGIETGFENFGK